MSVMPERIYLQSAHRFRRVHQRLPELVALSTARFSVGNRGREELAEVPIVFRRKVIAEATPMSTYVPYHCQERALTFPASGRS